MTIGALAPWAGLAQLVEQRFCKPKVAGSIPALGTTRILMIRRQTIDLHKKRQSHALD
jgi:hypothetical protein